MKTPVFNLGNPIMRQIAQREDGIWFERLRRVNGPGYSAWKPALIVERPIHAWYSGQHARLPKCDKNLSVNESDA